MFRKINLKNNNEKDKLVLYKNAREECGEIPIEFIDSIDYELKQSSTLSITIPNKVTKNSQTIYNPIFDKVLGKRQQMSFNGYKYVVTECDRSDTRDKKTKSIVAKSYDITLEDSHLYCPMGGLMRHLVKRDNEYETADGYLDLFVKENPMWSIGHVDDSCRTELNKVSVEQETGIGISVDNVAYDKVLFEKDFNSINPSDENSTVGIRLSFRDMESYDPATGKLLNTQTYVTDLGLFHTGVKKIKATFIQTDSYRYAIEYLVTLTNDTTVTRVCEFVDIKGYNVKCPKCVLLFTDGRVEEVSMLKYRNLEENVYTWRTVLVDYITESFDCFVIFDNKNMTVNVYDKKTFGDNKGVYLSYDNFVKGINKKYQYEDIISKLVVASEQEGLSIVDENPNGTDSIYNYDYFINNGIMSGECASAWKLYESRIDGVQEGLYNLRVELNTKNSLKIKLETEMTTLEQQTKGLEAIRVGYAKEGDTENANRLTKEINANYDRIAVLVQELAKTSDEISNIKKQIQVIVDSIDMAKATDESGNKIFTSEDLLEIQSLTIAETYTDKYYLTNYGLYNNSKEILKERNKLQIDFSIDLVGLLQNLIVPKGLTWDYYIKIGDKINLDDSEIEGDIRIAKISYSPKDNKVTSISFTNKDKEIDDLQAIGNIGRTISKLDTNNNMYKPEWKKGMSASKYVDDMLSYGLNLKATGIRSRSYSCKTDFSESGLFCINGYDESEQLFLAGGVMAITKTKWEDLKVCIDTDGIVARQIYGELIASKNLIIGNENNTMIIDDEGITIESNCLKIKGVEGGDYTFSSYFEMVNNAISLGVKNSKDYTDAQIKIVDGKIELKTSKDEVKSIIEQTPESVKVGFNGISDKIVMDINGLEVNDGGIYIKNILKQLVMSCDNKGWLTAGNLFITGLEDPANLEIGGNNGNKGIGIRTNSSNGTAYIDFAMMPKESTFAEQVASGGFHRIVSQEGSRDTLRIVGGNLDVRNFAGRTSMTVQGELSTSERISTSGNVEAVGVVATNLSISGSKNCNQQTDNYGNRLINAYETAEYFFGDLGEGIINNGECLVYLDEVFKECVNTNLSYHVFVQCYKGGISSIERFSDYFIVKGENGTSFSWEVKAKRRGYEQDRLVMGDVIENVESIDDLFYINDLVYTSDDFYIKGNEKLIEEILLTEE